jgi:hypothetical protein
VPGSKLDFHAFTDLFRLLALRRDDQAVCRNLHEWAANT